MSAEQSLEQQGIHAEFTKPHPFMFLKGHYGGKISDLDIYNGRYDRAACKTNLVVGDAGADLFAAKEAGCAFAAVLTGVQGQAARAFSAGRLCIFHKPAAQVYRLLVQR